MNQRQAKREACFRASLVLETALGSGWLLDDDPRIVDGVHEIIEELARRGWKQTMADVDQGKS